MSRAGRASQRVWRKGKSPSAHSGDNGAHSFRYTHKVALIDQPRENPEAALLTQSAHRRRTLRYRASALTVALTQSTAVAKVRPMLLCPRPENST